MGELFYSIDALHSVSVDSFTAFTSIFVLFFFFSDSVVIGMKYCIS